MKKLIVLAGAVALLVAAPAPAKTITVDISKVGFVPAAVSVQTGDSVTWTNKDTVNHQVVCTACPFTSPVLTPGATFTFTFTKAGKFTTVDPLNKNKKGTVTVSAAAGDVDAVGASEGARDYGSTATLAGVLSTAAANQKVDILAQTVRRERREGRRDRHDDDRRQLHVPGSAHARHELPGAVQGHGPARSRARRLRSPFARWWC